MDVRENVVWHDGTPFTPDDVIWSIQREGKPDGGNPVAFIWAGIDNFKVDGKRITADVKQYDPVIFKWMAFLTGYVLPKAYYEKVGADGFICLDPIVPRGVGGAPTFDIGAHA